MMKKWSNPDVVDLKISLTAGVYGGILSNKNKHSYHTPAPTVVPTPEPSFNPSEILNIDDFVEDENW